MTANMPDPQPGDLPQRDPGATLNANKPAATTQAPATPNGWNDPWTRPSAWAAFGSNTQEQS